MSPKACSAFNRIVRPASGEQEFAGYDRRFLA
jgi:hypothetical protein